MKVYVCYRWAAYAGCNLKQVFASEEKAKAWVDFNGGEDDNGGYAYDEMEVE
jgi:hypothetical protein